ncbi:MAG: hypothetical protein H0V01_08050 [Bacteroidetes bacterium]|nr:hypothetical protein [Bacteroidota bacterium]HET6243483.1 hypothetical protein [Bacteroidia bacterium]
MENIDVKTIIYFVIAIVWFLYSTFRKSQNKAKKQSEALPPLKNQEIREIVKEDSFSERKYLEEIQNAEIISIRKPKIKKKVASAKTNQDDYFSDANNRIEDGDKSSDVLAGLDPRDMVIYSEILKRPIY